MVEILAQDDPARNWTLLNMNIYYLGLLKNVSGILFYLGLAGLRDEETIAPEKIESVESSQEEGVCRPT